MIVLTHNYADARSITCCLAVGSKDAELGVINVGYASETVSGPALDQHESCTLV